MAPVDFFAQGYDFCILNCLDFVFLCSFFVLFSFFLYRNCKELIIWGYIASFFSLEELVSTTLNISLGFVCNSKDSLLY